MEPQVASTDWPKSRSRLTSSVRGASFRTDIQALRAIAVVLVVLDHIALLQRLPGHPEGGFIGVDIFFVISGFLITGHLVREVGVTGKVSYARFYARRARRILPMALLVAGVTILLSFLVFWPSRAWSSFWDGIWSLGFVSNVNFALQGTDYFGQSSPSIFQHYWSLSVEEQFYILWPLMITATATIAVRRKKNPSSRLAQMMIAVGLLSLAWAIIETFRSPEVAYFSTFARGFEFVLGALVAIGATRLAAVPHAARVIASAVAVGGLAASVYIVTPAGGFPGPGALLPALFAALFIAAGTGSNRPVAMWPLNSRLFSYIGDISFSLYLWHWPVIVILEALISDGLIRTLTALTVTFLLSAASYRWVEQAVLSSGWLQRRPTDKSKSRTRPLLACTAMLATLVLAATSVAVATVASRERDVVVLTALQDENQSSMPAAVADIQEELREAQRANTWDGLSPKIDEAAAASSGVLDDGCWNDRASLRNHCVIGPKDAAKTLVVFGDSLAMNWVEGLWEVVRSKPGWNLSIYAKVGCPYADVAVFDTDGSLYSNCDTFRSWAIEEINSEDAELIVLASGLKKTLPGQSTVEGVAKVWAKGVGLTLDALRAKTAPLILTAPPEGQPLESCANRFSSPSMCGTSVSELWSETWTSTTEAAATRHARVVDVRLWFCTSRGYCPPVIGNTPVRRDTVHMTDEYSRHLASALSEVLPLDR